MKTLYTFILGAACLVQFTACNNPNPAPKDLIESNKMADVLIDVRIVEGMYGLRVNRTDTLRKALPSAYELLFAKHAITREQFQTSYQYYLQMHDQMIAIEDTIMARLQRMQSAHENEWKEIISDTLSVEKKALPVAIDSLSKQLNYKEAPTK
jgi:hypothetical protein